MKVLLPYHASLTKVDILSLWATIFAMPSTVPDTEWVPSKYLFHQTSEIK